MEKILEVDIKKIFDVVEKNNVVKCKRGSLRFDFV